VTFSGRNKSHIWLLVRTRGRAMASKLRDTGSRQGAATTQRVLPFHGRGGEGGGAAACSDVCANRLSHDDAVIDNWRPTRWAGSIQRSASCLGTNEGRAKAASTAKSLRPRGVRGCGKEQRCPARQWSMLPRCDKSRSNRSQLFRGSSFETRNTGPSCALHRRRQGPSSVPALSTTRCPFRHIRPSFTTTQRV
jgi:hypothetical protein